MRKSTLIKQDLQTKRTAQVAIVEGAKDEKGEKRSVLTADETAQFDALQTEIDGLVAELRRAEQFEANQRAAAAGAAPADHSDEGEDEEKKKIKKRFSISRAINLAKEGKPIDGVEGEMLQEALAENKRAGVQTDDSSNLHIPSFIMRADAQTVTEDSGNYGGATVVDDTPRAQIGFTPKLFLEELGATRLRGLSGGDIPLPVFNDYDFAWLTETGAISSQKKQIDGPKLNPKRLGAAVPISNRWLMQSTVGDGLIMRKLGKGYDNALQGAAVNGPGTGNAPTGVLNNPGILHSATVAAADATWAMMVELQGLIEAADASDESTAYLLSPQLKATLKTITKDAGSGRFLMEGNQIDGIRARATSLVPELAGQKVLLYGDFSQLFIGEWGAVSMLVDPYSRAKENSIELIVNAHADVQIAQPTAFADNKFLN